MKFQIFLHVINMVKNVMHDSWNDALKDGITKNTLEIGHW